MMKLHQWLIAVVVLAAMVFALTYAMNYLGSTKGKPHEVKPTRDMLKLTFPRPTADKEPYVEAELHHPGKWDFWFMNNNSQPVKVGVQEASCKCASVKVSLLSEDHRRQLAAAAASQVLLPVSLGGLQVFVPPVAFQEERLAHLIADGTPTEALTADNDVTVPVDGIGIVRMTFKAEAIGGQVIIIKLWTDVKNTTPTKLETKVLILTPLLVEEKKLGTLHLKNLPRQTEVICSSLTRDSLNLKAEIDPEGRDKDSDPFEVGTPVRLSETEASTAAGNRPPPRCSYRIPVTLKPVAKDKTPVEIGSFRRRVVIGVVGEEDVKAVATISGEVEGDLSVVGLTNGAIEFDTFSTKFGKSGTVVVQCDVKDMDLEVDTKRTSNFLKVDLEGPTTTATNNRRSWKLTVDVLPNEVHGKFPNPEYTRFRDSAVYLKSKGPAPRSIRIPVSGTAS